MIRRLPAALVAAAAVVALGRPGSAEDAAEGADPTRACIAAHVEAQRLEKAGKLREARSALVKCSDRSCPAVLANECGALFGSIEARIPTVVFEAKDADGRDVADARVLEGDVVLAERLDGRAVELDPGEHRFRFERGDERAEQVFVVREGDRARRIAMTFGRPAGRPPEPERGIPTTFWIMGSIGIAGLTAFAGLGGAGLAKRNHLEDRSCAPNCPREDVDEVRALFLGADITLGIGLAALAVTPLAFFLDEDEGGEAPAITLLLAPGAGGGSLSAGGRW